MHNIKPELVPAILQVLDEEPQQCRAALSTGPGCYCFEGVIAEALCRLYPDRFRWTYIGNERTLLWNEIPAGAGTLWRRALAEITIGLDEDGDPQQPMLHGVLLWVLNDNLGKDFAWFREQLTTPAPN